MEGDRFESCDERLPRHPVTGKVERQRLQEPCRGSVDGPLCLKRLYKTPYFVNNAWAMVKTP